jgi:hypothetical protein
MTTVCAVLAVFIWNYANGTDRVVIEYMPSIKACEHAANIAKPYHHSCSLVDR